MQRNIIKSKLNNKSWNINLDLLKIIKYFVFIIALKRLFKVYISDFIF